MNIILPRKMLVTSNIANAISLDKKEVSVHVWVSRFISKEICYCYFIGMGS